MLQLRLLSIQSFTSVKFIQRTSLFVVRSMKHQYINLDIPLSIEYISGAVKAVRDELELVSRLKIYAFIQVPSLNIHIYT